MFCCPSCRLWPESRLTGQPECAGTTAEADVAEVAELTAETQSCAANRPEQEAFCQPEPSSLDNSAAPETDKQAAKEMLRSANQLPKSHPLPAETFNDEGEIMPEPAPGEFLFPCHCLLL